MEEEGVEYEPCAIPGTVVYLAAEKEFLGTIVISDTVKPEAKRAIAQLKKSGVKKTVMLTGDRKDVGEAVAESLGIDEVYTDLLPGDKVDKVEALLGELGEKEKLSCRKLRQCIICCKLALHLRHPKVQCFHSWKESSAYL